MYVHAHLLVCDVCRYLALVCANAVEGDYVFIPEWPVDLDWETKMCKKLSQACI